MSPEPISAPPDSSESASLARFWQPRYWLLWIGLGLLRLAVALPLRIQQALGRGLGRLLLRALTRRRAVADTNLRLCFPELDDIARRTLLRRHFESLGIAAFEMGMAWWASDSRIRQLVTLHGVGHLEAAMAGGRGVILVSGHFAASELTGRALKLAVPQLAALYRPSDNAFVDAVLTRGRLRSVSLLIPKDSMRQMLRALKSGLAVWYAPDQSHRRKLSALLPFLGEPAMTNTALTQIVRLSGAAVLAYLPRRRADGSGYDATLLLPLADFPGPDAEHDTARVNAILEQHIREAPEQYYWVHRRFKGRPAPWPDPYA
jgi:KDO2-lipid IV(A) lauroyltransferase